MSISMISDYKPQPGLISYRSQSPNFPHSPKGADLDEPLNVHELSLTSLTLSENKKKKGLDIPYIQINHRNLERINDCHSFLALFLSQIKSTRDPDHITEILESEVK